MEYGGVIVVAVLAVVVAMIPQLVARRTAITQSRENDRFSPRMRLISTRRSDGRKRCGHGHVSILPTTCRTLLTAGGTMAYDAESMKMAHASRSRAVKETATLRAARAARLSREAAAGQRRMLLAAVLAVATVGLGVAIPLMSWNWLVLLLTIVPLVAVIGWSRYAAIGSERAGQAEVARLRELREQASVRPTRVIPAMESVAVQVQRAADERVEAELMAETASVEAELVAPVEEAAETVEEITVVAEAEPALEAVGSWTVAHIPAPTYALRGRVEGRSVRVDTDLRGIPQVQRTSVPARPVSVSPLPVQSLSTKDVVAGEVVTLDLDSVLEARRAQ